MNIRFSTRIATLSVIAILIVLASSCNTNPDLNDPEVQAAISEARNLGLAYLEENQLAEAEVEFNKLVDLNPEDPAGYANLGVVFLRRGEFEQAEANLLEALEKAPSDPDIYLTLASVYEQIDDLSRARSLISSSIERNPDHVQTLYKRAQLYANDASEDETYAELLRTVIQYAPANIVPRFQLVVGLADIGRLEEALVELVALQQQLPEIPREAITHFENTVQALESTQQADAARSARIFHNLMKATPYYQTSLRLLGLRTDAAAGVPIITEPTGLTQSSFLQEEGDQILDRIQFTDASENAGITALLAPNTTIDALVVFDMDGDNEVDLLASTWNDDTQSMSFHLLQNRFGRFSDVTLDAGLSPLNTRTQAAATADFDNDTFLDILIVNESGRVLYKNNGDGTFGTSSRTGEPDRFMGEGDTRKLLPADLDHDGDLDVVVLKADRNHFLRNDGEGAFTPIDDIAGLTDTATASYDLDFGDFDDDGDLDLIQTSDEGITLLSNARQGQFERITPEAFITVPTPSATAVADYNNDGFLDIYTAQSGDQAFFLNQGNNQFIRDTDATVGLSTPLTDPRDAFFLDIDNDGYQDLVSIGERLMILHNTRAGGFTDATNQLMDSSLLDNARSGFYTDYNLDRDLDIIVRRQQGITLLRNDGGQSNRMVSIQTRGLVNNNAKNNYYSIGAKIELRAGDLYQTQVVTSPVTYFGIGKRVKADVIRIVFTNGVPQNIFRPGTDQDIIEQQILKGSCPFLYTWNGSTFTFATDLIWRSALGMPLGIMAAEASSESQLIYAPALPARDYVMIPEESLLPDEGRYLLKITGELWETPYIDEVKLLLVDTPDSLEIRIDEKFGPAPARDVEVYALHQRYPVTARNGQNEDVTDLLANNDNRFVSPLRTTRYQGLMEPHTLTLESSEYDIPDDAVLYLKGWIFPTDASINVAMSQSKRFESNPIELQVLNEQGEWITTIPNIGFPMGKNKVVRVDLKDAFLTTDRSVRIVSTMQVYWDEAYFATEVRQPTLRRTTLSPQHADLQYRGFSRMYRTSPFSPHLFDHDHVDTSPRWLDLEGFYTRYGEVQELLQSTNDQYVIMNAGDAITISFDANAAPPLSPGWSRHFILYTNGWLKDGDLNIASGNTVEPLPFVGMTRYPYDRQQERYPMTPSNKTYIQTYNTRKVSRDNFRTWIHETPLP